MTFVLENKKSVDDPKDIANIFNNFFANVDKTTEKEIPQVNHSPLFYLTNELRRINLFISCNFTRNLDFYPHYECR